MVDRYKNPAGKYAATLNRVLLMSYLYRTGSYQSCPTILYTQFLISRCEHHLSAVFPPCDVCPTGLLQRVCGHRGGKEESLEAEICGSPR